MTRLFCIALLAAQTAITPPDNKYSPAEDVKLGQEAAAQAEQQLPIMRDDAVTSYVEGIGRRLVAAIPENLRQPEFRYTFKVVNVREINAFALPGGPMFVNRGMIEAARTEGEVAGVMAHELSHVDAPARHRAGQQGDEISVRRHRRRDCRRHHRRQSRHGDFARARRFGLGTAFLRYGREYEKQADLEGAQIMARAGYDPRDMANMFKTIEKQGGSGGPQWLSDHPNPGNRVKYITDEAARTPRREPDPRHQRVRAGQGASAASAEGADHGGGDEVRRKRSRPGHRKAALRERRAAVVTLHDLQGRQPVPGQRAVQLARAAREQCRHLRAGGRLRSDQRAERVHARGGDRGVAQRDARSADRDRRAGAIAVERQPGSAARLRIRSRRRWATGTVCTP